MNQGPVPRTHELGWETRLSRCLRRYGNGPDSPVCCSVCLSSGGTGLAHPFSLGNLFDNNRFLLCASKVPSR
jgi:hypothetical protein